MHIGGSIVRPCWEKLLRVCYQVSHQVTATPWKEFQLAGASRGEFPTQAAAPGPEPGTATVSRAGAVTRVFKFHERPDYIHIVQGPPDSWTGHGAEGGSGYWITLKTWIKCSYLCWQVTLTSRSLEYLISAQGLLLDRSFPYLNMYVLIYEQMKILILI